MSQFSILNSLQLETGLVLVPERYDPRRRLNIQVDSTVLDVAAIVSKQVLPGKEPNKSYLVIDTTDAREGVIYANKSLVSANGFASAKKLIRSGDVIISRLRPYLHQIAYFDPGLSNLFEQPFEVVCSTEFFVLRSRDQTSIAFLVPYLLSRSVQAILAASQEGGHHPRFPKTTLQGITIPNSILDNRDQISSTVEATINTIRQSTLTLQNLLS